MNADVLYTSDLHGSEPHYREALDLARDLGVRAILLGGDLALHGSIAEQHAFYQDFFLPLFRAHFAASGAAEVWWIMGNDDWAAHVPLLEGAGLPRFRHVHGRVVPFLDGWSLAGMAHVSASPFALKDWERWEEGLGPATRWEGFRSSAGGHSRPFSFVGREREESLAAEFEAIGRAFPSDASRVVCMFHAPPHGTALDQIHGRVHVGSREVRRFLEARQPALSLHGHIHESPDVSGKFADLLGRTVCVNPGQSPREPLRAVSFSMSDPAGTLRHTRMGAAS
ncbi:MAG TPA: metallophosphoesterase [Candidatus Eisenbacteria bacterium]|nr:metallophosphoesterase [Candidatus Eisenbacteria bacterium]